MNTYNIIGSMFGVLLIALPISADNTQQAYKNLKIQNKAIRKVGNQVKVAMDLNLDQIQLASNNGLIYTPMILNEKDTLFMPSVEVMGKRDIFTISVTRKRLRQTHSSWHSVRTRQHRRFIMNMPLRSATG